MTVTTPDELARRAVACKHWRWLPGTAAYRLEGRKQYRFVGGSTWAPGCVVDPYTLAFADMVLDLDDPATRGCLLELVRRAWGPLTVTYVHDQRWRIWSHDRWLDGYHESEVAALVAALEEP